MDNKTKDSKRFANGKVYINGIIEVFWSYAKGKLLKYHRVIRI